MKSRLLTAAIAMAAFFCAVPGAKGQSSIMNPMTQAVLAVYQEELDENPRDYNVLMSRADEYYRHSEYIKALDDVNKVLEYTPLTETDVLIRAYVLRGGIYNQTNRPELAIADLNQAVALNPDSYSIIYQKANTDYSLGNYTEAKEGYRKLERLNPRTAEPYIGQARVAVKENNLGIANEMLAKAVDADPNNAETFIRRASVRRQMGDHNGAVDDLILALSNDSKNSRAISELLEYGNTNYPATMAGLTNAITQAPEVGMFRYIRAVIAQAHFHYLAAIADYQEILDKGLYNYHGIYASIAECNFALGNYDVALDEVNKALSMIRDNASHYVLKSKIYRAKGDYENAVKAGAEALAVDRQSNDALVEMALGYVGQAKYDQASDLLGEAMLNNAQEARFPMLRAWVMEKYLNKESAARNLYEQVAGMDNYFIDNPRSLKGFALLKLDRKDEALRWMDNILVNVYDYDGLIHYYGACFYSQTGDLDKAMKCAADALDLGYANYHAWTEATDGYVNVAPLRDDLKFYNLLHRHDAIFGKEKAQN